MSWFAAARVLQAEAARERERHPGVTVAQLESLREALRIFDQQALAALFAEASASALDACARVLEARGRYAETPGPK